MIERGRREGAVAVAALVLAGLFLPGARAQEDDPPGIETIRKEDLRADLFFVASDEMRGRLAGSAEARIVAAFLRSRFERAGLAPAGPSGSYYHPFRVVAARLGEENRLELAAGGARLRLVPGQDYFPLRESASAVAEGPVVFAGFGIVAPEKGHDDYRGADVAGKIVLVLDHEPGEDDPESVFDGLVRSEASALHRKIRAAQQRGAAGLLVVHDLHQHAEPEGFDALWTRTWPATPPRVERVTLADWVEPIRIPAARISVALGETLAEAAGRSLAELAREARAVALPGTTVRLATDVRRRQTADRNVVALVEGSDPELRDEWVVVCAHYDHDGADGDRIFNGADDDGSGTVGLLEIAEAYAEAARRGRRPRRSVLLAAWNYEERGLLGAWAYTERPLHPLDRTVAVLNMDMIGRDEEVPVGGGPRFRGLDVQTAASNENAVNVLGATRSADLRGVVEEANRGIDLTLRFRYDNNPSNLLRRSDHWPFLQVGVPALFFHTGLHPDYHRPDDDAERIRYDKLERIVRLVYRTSWRIADAPARPRLTSSP